MHIQQVAVLGLGIIGSRAAQQLIDAGFNVRAWNRSPKELPAYTPTLADAILGADVITLYLKDVPAVRETFGQALPLLQPGQIIINHSTIDLETTHWLHAQCQEHQCTFLDVPFTGSKIAAENGQLVYYTAGNPEILDQLDTFLSHTSKKRLYCGAIGSAMVVKLATNLISACTVQALAEAMAITGSHGIEPSCMIQAISENVSGSPLAAMKLPTMVAGDFDTHFSLANMGKDSRYMLDLAKQADLDTPGIAAVSKRMLDLCDQGLADLDYSALAKPYLHP